ncbi:MAG: class I SAM-dependent methyltransferase, partial [Candidatus Portnoybacteria bacterium]|nr:class I SAM-dependent methyltransferase [Candidatus Portnoybacteria bacterium]
IGCGNGFYLDVYQKIGIPKNHIIGVDIAPRVIQRLKEKGFSAMCANILNLTLDDDVSDITIAQGVIHHTSDPFKAFGELVRITKPGGYIYLNVYNKWHPYFYLVHRATWPIRYMYYNWSKRIVNVMYPFVYLVLQPLAWAAFGEFLDAKTGRALFMDQVITPRAHLFSKSMLLSYAKKSNCTIQEFAYNRYYLMLATVIKVKDPPFTQGDNII